MTVVRKITVILTEAQYEALGSAVDERFEQYRAGDLQGQPGAPAHDRALHNAWSRIHDAWHSKAHPAARHE